MALIECNECGNQVSDKATSCPKCGAPINNSTLVSERQPIIVTAPKSRSLAVALALLLGGLGIHKFYLNRPGWGFIYIFFCWTLIPALISYIEALMYIFMSDGEFQSKYATHKTA